jgi:hypothetical protein
MWIWSENNGKVRSWSTLRSSQHFGGRGACWSSGMGTKKSDKHKLLTCTTQTTSCLVCSLSAFGVRTSHEQTRTHKIQHGLDLGEAITFPLIVYFVLGNRTSTQMSFFLETPKWESRNSKIETPTTLRGHNIVYRPLIEMRFEEEL